MVSGWPRCASAPTRSAGHVPSSHSPMGARACWRVFPLPWSWRSEMPANLLRVLIADDHPLFRSGLRALLAASAETEVAGEATTGEEAVELEAALQPDVI